MFCKRLGTGNRIESRESTCRVTLVTVRERMKEEEAGDLGKSFYFV